jgi:NAD(P)H-dependent FMN reductase
LQNLVLHTGQEEIVMKLMAIVGSPRRGSNTDILVDKVIEGYRSKTDAEVEKVFVVEKKIEYCRGCLSCQFPPPGTKKCVIKDDMAELLEGMEASDAFIFGTPNHMRTVSAPLLNFFARMVPLLELDAECNDRGETIGGEWSSRVRGKRAAVVISQGDPFFSSALVHEVLDRNFNDFKLRKVGDVTSLGNIPKGAVAEKAEELKKALEVGVKLFEWTGML